MFAGYDMTPFPYRPNFDEFPLGRGLSYQEGEEISREMFANPFFAGWFLAGERVNELAGEYRRDPEKDQVLELFCNELLAPELQLIKERLLSCADLLRRCSNERSLVAKLLALAGSLVGSPLPHHLHPFLRRFALESLEIAGEALSKAEQLQRQER
jgi:hypothetical protein